ncbi:mechanosensitive ion channel family protein [Alteromonas oceanisediminis]|uniref:mechanosensitive ion channel family protein n=1 Tax=Alteromonas oceanisediminis TaxID=2836180 RepID=UPI001BDA4606|nr:mechanosensitive ion channel domain-containing protein [Alteromonas oceanisediminis]MBT0586515.1 mechanosensitive ion channel family protein [Alteromonas oceanisediminis]
MHALPLWLAIVVLCTFFLIALGLILQGLLLLATKALARTPFVFDTILLNAAKRPLRLLIVSMSLLATQSTLIRYERLDDFSRENFLLASKFVLIVGLILFADSLVRQSLIHYQARSPLLRTSGKLVRGALRILVLVTGVLVLLTTLGISITPIVASLGIGSLAVALALQPTLENFFSGMQILADKPIRLGDYIELESGEQGFVEQIGWRSVWIKMLPNNIVIVPNSVLAKSKIINYYYPEKQLSVPVDCSVHYDSDLDEVERVALEVAREILISYKWGIDDYDTFVVFHTFDNSSINFTVMLRAQEYFNRFFIKSAYIKALHKRFKKEGIVIPYPISAINLSQERPTDDLGSSFANG